MKKKNKKVEKPEKLEFSILLEYVELVIWPRWSVGTSNKFTSLINLKKNSIEKEETSFR